jgi:antimicrobial peptide system SdpB family protein
MFAPEWNNGTSMYYWVTSPMFGAPDWLLPWLLPVVRNGTSVTLLTWGVMLFEVVLSIALVMRRRWWQPLLVAGLLFHLGIAVLHGLFSFMFAMDAALVLLLRPWDRPFDARTLRTMLAGLRLRARQRPLAAPGLPGPALNAE